MFGYWKIKGTMGGVEIDKKIQEKKKLRKIKKKLKVNKLFLHASSYSFHLF